MAETFDERAATWDEEPRRVQRARDAAAAIRDGVELRPDLRMLEYGAGTGLVSQELAPHVGTVLLADPSAGMREVAQRKIDQGLLGADARVIDLDLARDPVPDERVDLVVTVMALHHVPEVPPVLQAFAAMLDDGGTLAIVDLEREDGSFHSGQDFDGHDGFDREQLTAWLGEAGFDGVRIGHAARMTKDDREYDLFLATCERSPD